MPNIEEFTAGNIDIRPQEIGVESTAAAGRRMGVYGSQIAESYKQAAGAVGQIATAAEQYIEHREINTGAKHAADFVVNHNQSWNDFITGKDIDPNDPSRQDQINARINNPQAAKQWRETQLEPDLAQFQQGFLTQGGQQWASRFVNTYRDHIATKAAADQSSMAGAVVQANIEKTGDALAVATFNDPSSLKTNFDLLHHSIEGSVGSSPTMSPEVSTRISAELAQRHEEKLVQAAIQGTIIKGGNWQAIANDKTYAPYIKPQENAMFARQAQTYARMDRAAANQERAMTDYVNKQNWNAAADKLELGTLPQRPGDTVGFRNQDEATSYWDQVKAIGTKPGTDPARLRALIDNGEKLTERMNMPKVATDPGVRDQLYAKAVTGELTERDIATNITHLDDNDTKRLGETIKMFRDAEFNDPFVKEALAGAKELIEGKTDLERSMSAGKFAAFEYKFLGDYAAAVRAGNVPSNALDLEGGTGDRPPSMISEAMKPYKNTVQDILRTSIGVNGLAAPPPVPTQPARPAAPTTPAAVTAPAVGTIRFYQGKAYQFQGGDWNDPKSWKETTT